MAHDKSTNRRQRSPESLNWNARVTRPDHYIDKWRAPQYSWWADPVVLADRLAFRLVAAIEFERMKMSQTKMPLVDASREAWFEE